MNWKWLVVTLVAVRHIYRLVLNIMKYRSAENPTPDNVADVYDAEAYEKWKRYNAENGILGAVATMISFVVRVALLWGNVYAAIAAMFPETPFWQLLSVLWFECMVEAAVNVGLNYVQTMIIEEKYGFNRSTMKTFVFDQIRDMILDIVLSVGITWILSALHRSLGDWMILLFAGILFCITMAISFLYPIFSRIGNTFDPLVDGELKDRLVGLLTKHGYQVKAIEVMDASRRTTKLNAYFTGFGKMKTIVLYDNLVNTMSDDEICAVFAHELGHGLHKDVLKQQIMNLGNLLLMAVVVWLAVREPQIHEAFGFNQVNYGFAYILLGVGVNIVQPLTGMAMNAYSRFAEYRADRQAVEEGCGKALISGLKKLARANFAHLAPDPLLVILKDSHPPLSERIAAIEQAQNEKLSKMP